MIRRERLCVFIKMKCTSASRMLVCACYEFHTFITLNSGSEMRIQFGWQIYGQWRPVKRDINQHKCINERTAAKRVGVMDELGGLFHFFITDL